MSDLKNHYEDVRFTIALQGGGWVSNMQKKTLITLANPPFLFFCCFDLLYTLSASIPGGCKTLLLKIVACEGPLIMMTGSVKKKKKLKKKGGGVFGY